MPQPAGTRDTAAPSPRAPLGWWRPDAGGPTSDPVQARDIFGSLRLPVAVVRTPTGFAVAAGGVAQLGATLGPDTVPLVGYLQPLTPADLGDPAFLAAHGLKYPYMTGSMANG